MLPPSPPPQPSQIEQELRKEIANDKTSKKRHVHSFPLSARLPPQCRCGNYNRCITSRLNRPPFCVYSRRAQCSRMLSSNRRNETERIGGRRGGAKKNKKLAGSLCYSTRALGSGCSEEGRREEGKKINAVKCEDRKMSFWQMQGFVYAQIEFWWISPQARSASLIYKPSYKNVKQWCYKKKIQMSLWRRRHATEAWFAAFFETSRLINALMEKREREGVYF